LRSKETAAGAALEAVLIGNSGRSHSDKQQLPKPLPNGPCPKEANERGLAPLKRRH